MGTEQLYLGGLESDHERAPIQLLVAGQARELSIELVGRLSSSYFLTSALSHPMSEIHC